MSNRTLLLIVLGLMLLGGGVAVMVPEIIKRISRAIATAEGYYVAGSVPFRLNNPGDLTVDTTGKAIGTQGIYQVYASAQDGWEALYKQVALMFSGSHIYNPSMTIRQIALRYTSTEQESWAENVANVLGVSVDTKLSEIF